MALRIRMRKQGRHARPFYRVVLTDVHAPRDGKYIENLGWYNPFEKDTTKNVMLKADRVQHWLAQGAEITDKVACLLKRGAPEVMQQYNAKIVAQKTKETKARRTRRQNRKNAASAA